MPRVSRGGDIDDEFNEEIEEQINKGQQQGVALVTESLRKTFLAMADDPLVVLIKLADRLHNMRTLKFVPPHKQERIARETMDIFAPLASRLGIWQMKWELEDRSFRYLDNEKYTEIAGKLDQRRSTREKDFKRSLINC